VSTLPCKQCQRIIHVYEALIADCLASLFVLLFQGSFPEAPEVKAALATFLAAKGDQVEAQRKYLEIPNQQRKMFTQDEYLKKVIAWPPAAIDTLGKISTAVGDKRS
jgi:hypothetical protein